MTKVITREEAWEFLTDNGIATNEEITLVTCINGYTIEALRSILYARTGYRDFDQYETEEA